MNNVVELSGTYKRTICRDLKSGYTVFVLSVNYTGTKKDITCTGEILPIQDNTQIHVTGCWEESRLYGRRLVDAKITKLPTDKTEMLRYLVSGSFGFGISAAQEIVSLFGFDPAQYLSNPLMETELRKIRGVTQAGAHKLLEQLKAQQRETQLYFFLIEHGGDYQHYLKAFDRLGDNALQIIQKNPYEAGKRIGLDLQVCDSIFKQQGGKANNSNRVEFGIYWTLLQEASAGHTFCNKNDLLQKAQRALKNHIFPDVVTIPAVLLGLDRATRQDIVKEQKRYYLYRNREREIQLAAIVDRLLAEDCKRYKSYDENMASWVMEKMHCSFAEEQQTAFSLLSSPGIKMLIGSPGTGKTTVIRGLIMAFHKMFPQAVIKLCAPTGRAAQRMTESTGEEASTIHRLLGTLTCSGETLSRKSAEVFIPADMVIVDEASMLNLELANDLFSAIRPGTLVLLVGDTHQLPAIGAGNVLFDFIFSGLIPVVTLTKVFRQSKDSVILQNAQAINVGVSKLEEASDFKIVSAEDSDILEAVAEKFMECYDVANPYSVQVISSTVKTVEALNLELQKAVNKQTGGIHYGGINYRLGDKILMVRNNYKVGYYNGDIGLVTAIGKDCMKVRINQTELLLKKEELRDIQLGYAITAHKGQGSEFPTVMVVLPQQPQNMLQRKLLYTSITRGKNMVYLFAKEASIVAAISNNQEAQRNSYLIPRLHALAKKRGVNVPDKEVHYAA